MLEVKGISKSFGGIRALDNCGLNVKRGTITGLIGPNGAGKTTLFNLIAGVLRPDEGTIRFEGERIDGLPPHEVFSRKLVRTFQVSRALRRMTVMENLMLVPEGQVGESLLGAWLRPGMVRQQEQRNSERALAVLDFIKLYHLRDEYAGNLSTGQKKLLELARSLMTDAKLILLDEPGAGVNPTLMKELVAQIERLRDEGKTFFLIEHDMNLVMGICNPIIVMSDGRRLTEGTPEEIRQDRRVLEAYLGG